MMTDTLIKKPVLHDPYPAPSTRRKPDAASWSTTRWTSRIVAEMDAVFAMDRMLGDIDVDIRKVRKQPA